MIVRILNEGQYEVPSAQLDKLNEIDNKMIEAVAQQDEKTFKQLLSKMLKVIHEKGHPLKPQEIVVSQVVLPAPDMTLEEARLLFAGDGFIPG